MADRRIVILKCVFGGGVSGEEVVGGNEEDEGAACREVVTMLRTIGLLKRTRHDMMDAMTGWNNRSDADSRTGSSLKDQHTFVVLSSRGGQELANTNTH